MRKKKINFRVAKKQKLTAFKAIKGYTNAIDDITINCLLAFLRDIGSDGNLSRVPEKVNRIYHEFCNCQAFTEDCLKLLKNLVKEEIVPSQRLINGLSKILEVQLIYSFFVIPYITVGPINNNIKFDNFTSNKYYIEITNFYSADIRWIYLSFL